METKKLKEEYPILESVYENSFSVDRIKNSIDSYIKKEADEISGTNYNFNHKVIDQEDFLGSISAQAELMNRYQEGSLHRSSFVEFKDDSNGKINADLDVVSKLESKRKLAHDHFETHKKFEGKVVSIDNENNEFTAITEELGGKSKVISETVFDLSDVPENDHDLIAEGAIFYWYVGYLDNKDGNRSKVSEIRFRRLPAWTKNDIKKIDEIAADFAELF